MKPIYYIANVRIPTEKAHGVQIMKTCEAFANNGAEVTLLVPRRFNNLKRDPFEYYQVKKNFTIVRVPTIDLVMFGKLGCFIETAIFSELAVWCIRWCTRKNWKNKVIYSRDTWPLLNITLLGWKSFWEAHMGSESGQTKATLKRLTGLVTISSGLRELYEKFGFPAEKIFVSPDAVDLEQFETNTTKYEARQRLGLPMDKKIVMYIGLFDEWKGYRTLLEASELMSDPNIQIAMMGGTDTQIEKLKREYPRVNFLGYREYSELPAHQKAADLLVIPNSAKFPISKLYTSPMKLFAHMASGVPILAADVPSIREIVSESEISFFDADNTDDLARAITAVLGNPTMSARAERAKNKVAAYTWDNRAKGILNFIQKNV